MRKNRVRLAFSILLGVAASWSSLSAAYGQTVPPQREVRLENSQSEVTVSHGSYYALVIGVKNYKNFTRLETPLNDAKEVAATLREQYGFQTQVLLDATRDQILDALGDYRSTLTEDDSLLIYYAGHGYYDQASDVAYWYPVEAGKNSPARWINATEITGQARAVPARHVLVIADSCYSGMISEARFDLPTLGVPRARYEYLKQMIQRKSRRVMSSGGNEPVADNDPSGHSPGHSVFANALLQGLREFQADEYSAEELFDQYIRVQVAGQSSQVPGYTGIRNSDHEGGDFVFFRVPVAKAPNPPVVANALKPAAGSPAALELFVKAKKLFDAAAYVSAFPYFKESSDAGNVEATAYLGDYYSTVSPWAVGPPKDNVEAARLYRKAAEAGVVRGMVGLAYFYDGGYGVGKDYAEAVRWYRKAAEAGDAASMRGVGYMYENGYGVARDYAEAVRWYRKAADAGDAVAMRNLGIIYGEGHGAVQKDYAEAMRWYRKAAEAGDAGGMQGVGYLYERGYGVDRDYAEAVRWYRKGTDAGDAGGTGNLGLMYEYGRGVDKNYTEALRLYRKAADAGNASAMTNLAHMYYQGYGVDSDYAESARWYRKAAEGGDPEGMRNLGAMYANGNGLDKDYAKAVEWYRKAAEAGNAGGMYGLGYMYANGYGVDKDYAKAVELYRKAAAAGYVMAISGLGSMYENGYGVAKDYAEAVRLYRSAASQGDDYAVEQLQRLGEKR